MVFWNPRASDLSGDATDSYLPENLGETVRDLEQQVRAIRGDE